MSVAQHSVLDKDLLRLSWRLSGLKKIHREKGLPSPDVETARLQCLQPGIAAPEPVIVKDFIRFYISTSKPRLDAHRPTVDSINTVAEWFFTGFTRVAGTETVERERSEVYQVSIPYKDYVSRGGEPLLQMSKD